MSSRANQLVLLGYGLLCAAALLCGLADRAAAQAPAYQAPAAYQTPLYKGPAVIPAPAPVANFPVASDARLAGDSRQTRFILDLDKPVQFRAFTLADPYRVIVDLNQVNFQLPSAAGMSGRGLIKTFRYGLVMPGGSRIVFDLTGPAKIAKSYVLEAANGQPPRLVLELEEVDRTAFVQALAPENRPELRPGIAEANANAAVAKADTPAVPANPADKRPVIVVDPGHGGEDNGTEAGGNDIMEKNLVLTFGLALRDRLEKSGKYRVVMTRTDDTFIALGDRVKVARRESAALFISIHADALKRGEGDAQGATIYTLSDKATDSDAERLADAENKSDAIGGVKLADEPTEVADILIDLVQRETKTFSNRFARVLMGEMKTTVRMHKHPLKSAGFRVLKAPDVPSVLVELGYVSNKGDLEHLVSESWRNRTVGAMAQAIDAFLAKRLATAGPGK